MKPSDTAAATEPNSINTNQQGSQLNTPMASSDKTVGAAPLCKGLVTSWLTSLATADERLLVIAAFLTGAAVMLLHRPFSQLEAGDAAFYDYIAQTILRGGIPYRDVVDIKGPAAPYLSAFAIMIGKSAGLRDILAIRALHLLMVGLLSSVTFLVANAYLRSRAAALIAFIIPLMRDPFAEFMIGGTQPKLPMMIFGLLSLLMIAKDRPFWAGSFSMLSCLCWQPGLMFTGTAFLVFSRYLTNWRDWRAMKVLLGAAIPFGGVALYFYSKAAFGDLWSLTITYNYTVFGPEAKRGAGDALAHLWKVLTRVFGTDIVLVMLALGGYSVQLVGSVKAKFNGRKTFISGNTLRDALLIPPAVYFIFCLINFQAGPDLIPFIPFIGIFTAYFLVVIGRLLSSATGGEGQWSEVPWEAWVPSLAASIVLLLALFRGATYRPQTGAIQDQDKAFKSVATAVGPDDKIYVHGTTELLVLLDKPNLNPYLDFDWGKDNYLARKKYNGSFKALLDEMEAEAPKVVALSRLRVVAHRVELERWVAEHYDKLEVPGYEGIYTRKRQ